MTDDDFDEGKTWDAMCATVARQCSLSKEQVAAIADAAGLHVYNASVFDLEEVVEYQKEEEWRSSSMA